MNFKKIATLMLIILGIILLPSCGKEEKIVEEFPEMVTKLDSYKLNGKLESFFPTGSKTSLITVYYQKPELYRVEIENETQDDVQVIIKNQDGVFVLMPAINKSFNIKSSWPINSSYPYLLQSLSKDIVSDDNVQKMTQNGVTTLELKSKVFNDANTASQKISFTNDSKYPNEVLTYDQNKNLLSRFTISDIEENSKINADLFNVQVTKESALLDIIKEYDRAISYPSYYPSDGTVITELVTGGANNKTAIIKFGGENPFTLIEEYVQDITTYKTEYLSGDLYVFGNVVAIVNENNLMFYDNAIKYTLASNVVDIYEMIKISESLRIVDEK